MRYQIIVFLLLTGSLRAELHHFHGILDAVAMADVAKAEKLIEKDVPNSADDFERSILASLRSSVTALKAKATRTGLTSKALVKRASETEETWRRTKQESSFNSITEDLRLAIVLDPENTYAMSGLANIYSLVKDRVQVRKWAEATLCRGRIENFQGEENDAFIKWLIVQIDPEEKALLELAKSKHPRLSAAVYMSSRAYAYFVQKQPEDCMEFAGRGLRFMESANESEKEDGLRGKLLGLRGWASCLKVYKGGVTLPGGAEKTEDFIKNQIQEANFVLKDLEAAMRHAPTDSHASEWKKWASEMSDRSAYWSSELAKLAVPRRNFFAVLPRVGTGIVSEPVSVPPAEPVPVPRAEPVPVPRAEPVPVPRAEPVPVPRAEPVPVPSRKPSPVPRPTLPTAEFLSGGHIKSPFVDKVLDARGYKAGDRARCPYTNKVFIIPGNFSDEEDALPWPNAKRPRAL